MKTRLLRRFASGFLALMMLVTLVGCGDLAETLEAAGEIYSAVESLQSESAAEASTQKTADTTAAPSTTTTAATTTTTAAPETTTSKAAETTTAQTTTAAPETTTTTVQTTTAAPETTTTQTTAETSAEPELAEDGEYTSKEDVALYIHLYGHLPKNFVTKAEAQSQGWSGGGLTGKLKGYSIGGDRFGNREGLLPKAKGRTYTECDIDTKNAKSRGAKRIVFSNDGLIYYTDDHYESFELLYGEE